MKPLAVPAALAVAATSTLALAVPAYAAATDVAEMLCEGEAVTVTGFGRGQVLHVVGETQHYVVTRAERDDEVVFDNPGQAAADGTVTCATTSPSTGRTYVFEGFFTPLA